MLYKVTAYYENGKAEGVYYAQSFKEAFNLANDLLDLDEVAAAEISDPDED